MTRLYTISPTQPATVVHFDWLTLVVPIGKDDGERLGQSVESYINGFLADFGLDFTSLRYEKVKHGLYLYENCMMTGNNSIAVAWYQANEQGELRKDHCNFMLQMSGAGVETLESVLANNNLTVAEFIKNVVSRYGATFSRVDACNNFFNYGKKYSARYADEQASKGNLVTRASSIRRVAKYSTLGEKHDLSAYIGADQGYSTYIGKNPKQLRIYNKLAERSDKVNLLYQVKSWSRWEFQLNGDQAQGFINEYLKRDCNLAQTWVDWLATNYRFITRRGHGVHKQTNRSRYPTAKWYQEIIKTAKEKTIVRTEKQKPTFERSAKWIQKQVMPTLASIYEARKRKYILNGMSYKDACKVAFKKVENDIDFELVNQNVNERLISTWLAEEGKKIQ